MVSKDDLDRERYIDYLEQEEGWSLTAEQHQKLWRELRRRELLTRAQKVWLAVLAALASLGVAAQGVAALVTAFK